MQVNDPGEYYSVQFTLGELCDIAGVPVPDEMAAESDRILANVAERMKFARKDGAVFLPMGKNDMATCLDQVEKMRARGLAAIFVSGKLYDACENKERLIRCAYPARVAHAVARILREKHGNTKIIGITGSVGKTTTKELVHAVVRAGYEARKCFGNENAIIPILENLQKLPFSTEYYVQEFGIGDARVMPRAVKACLPDMGLITNIAPAHIETYGSLQGIMDEKAKMLTQMPPDGPAFLNWDDDMLRKLDLGDRKVIWFSAQDKAADYHAANIAKRDEALEFDVVHADKTFHIVLHMLGDHNVIDAVSAVAVGDYLQVPKEKIEAALAAYRPSGQRQSMRKVGGYQLYIDCYNNAVPEVLVGAVKALEDVRPKAGGRRIAVICDIIGFDRAVNEKLGDDLAKEQGIDLFICFGEDNAQALAEHIRQGGGKTLYASTREELDRLVREHVTRKDVVLFKGGHKRLLVRTIDHVFGTCLQFGGDAYDEQIGDFAIRFFYDEERVEPLSAAIAAYTGESSKVVVPATAKEEMVSLIGPSAFQGNMLVEKVDIEAPVTGIGARAFKGCENLKKIVLPKTLVGIGRAAFRDCKSLTKVKIPEGVIEIAEGAFRGCDNLREVVLPSTIGRIGNNAFLGCEDVKIVAETTPYLKQWSAWSGRKLHKRGGLLSGR